MKWRVVVPPEEPEPCAAKLSPRSTARCEMPQDHRGVSIGAEVHCGRTRGGYWKSWPVKVNQ